MKHRNNNQQKGLPSRLRRAALASCLFLAAHAAWAQEPQTISLDVPRIVPVSPEAAMMEKFQSYPVDHCTGVPEITIPLYEIDLGELTVPVTLSYHASGLKPKERSGIAGTGWTLNLEPSIMREVNGTPDDAGAGWFERYKDWEHEDEAKADNQVDTYPDKFIYRLPHGGGSGFFHLRHQPLQTSPRTNDRVEYHDASGMEITDERGFRYSFAGTVEKSGAYVTRWLCDGIYSPRNGEQLIAFSYWTREGILHPSLYYNLDNRLVFASKDCDWDRRVMMFDEKGQHYYRLRPGANEYEEPVYEPSSREECGLSYAPGSSFVAGDLSQAYLREASFMGCLLEASYRSAGDAEAATLSTVLDEITVTDASGTLVRRIRFHITPYNSGTSLTKLDSVVISAPGVESRVYRFSYKDSGSVPSIYTTAVDHWGFCNGREAGEGKTVPSVRQEVRIDRSGFANYGTYTAVYEGADREPHAEWAQIGLLTSVTTPQGVRTTFGYEGNAAAFRDSSKDKPHRDYLHPVGGVRLAQAESVDTRTGKRMCTYYTYGLTRPEEEGYEPVWGGGAVKHLVTQRDYFSKLVVVDGDPVTHAIWKEHLEFYSSMPVSNITFGNGSAVMYNVVEESVMGDDGSQHRTMYYYEADWHRFEDVLTWDDSDPEGSVRELLSSGITESTECLVRPEPYRPHEPSDDFTPGASHRMEGALLRTDFYRDGELVSRRENVWEEKKFWDAQRVYTSFDRQVLSLTDLYDPWLENDPVPFLQYDFIPDVHTFRMLSGTRELRFHRSGTRTDTLAVEQAHAYTYDFLDPFHPLRPVRTETRRSDGVLAADDYEYHPGYPSTLSFHRHTEAGDTAERRVEFVAGTPLPKRVQERSGGTAWRDAVVYTERDGNNNPAELRGRDGTPVCFLWGYCNRFPVAKVENATLEEVYAAMGSFVPEEMAARDEPTAEERAKLDALREKLPGARVTVYRYHPVHGLVSATDPNGVVTEFTYDGYGRLTESSFLDADAQKAVTEKYVYKF